jgi:hypothetical protein
MSSPENNIRVGIADNALVASFLTADAPRVWRTDLTQLLTAALEVQNTQGKYLLVMKRSNAPVEEIATFSAKEDAIKALQLITDALLNGKGTSAKTKFCGFKKFLKMLLGTIITLFVLSVVLSFISFTLHKHPATEGSANSTQAPAAQVTTGVPTPADEILGK